MSAPEFSRPQRLDQIGSGESQVGITADADERAALAARFGLVAIDRLDASFSLHRDASGIIARGDLSAAVIQSCVATGDPLPAKVDEEFALRFVPEGSAVDDEVELSETECDTIFYAGNAIDLGEAAAETLALALDPFPRSPRAAEILKAAGVLSEEEAGPFGALAGLLRDQLKR